MCWHIVEAESEGQLVEVRYCHDSRSHLCFFDVSDEMGIVPFSVFKSDLQFRYVHIGIQ